MNNTTKIIDFIKRLTFKLAIRCIPKFKSTQKTNQIGLSSVICHDKLDMFICSASSLMYHLGKTLPIYAIDDGTLSIADKKKLDNIFDITIESRKVRGKKWEKKLSRHHEFKKYRLHEYSPVTKLKYDAYTLSPFSKVIYFDLDVLFLKKPKLLSDWINSDSDLNYYCKYPRKEVKSDIRSDADYSFRYILDKFIFPMATLSFNSGIVAIANKSIINFNKLNEIFLFFKSIGYSKSFMAEETALSILFAKKNCKSLPIQEFICVAKKNEYAKANITHAQAIHFIAETKSSYISHALKLFKKTFFLRYKKQV